MNTIKFLIIILSLIISISSIKAQTFNFLTQAKGYSYLKENNETEIIEEKGQHKSELILVDFNKGILSIQLDEDYYAIEINRESIQVKKSQYGELISFLGRDMIISTKFFGVFFFPYEDSKEDYAVEIYNLSLPINANKLKMSTIFSLKLILKN